jgi:hypothetical protein
LSIIKKKKIAILRKEAHDFQLFVVVAMDRIWFSRNQTVHNSTQVDIHSLPKQIRLVVNNHKQAWENSGSGITIWKALPYGFLKANGFAFFGWDELSYNRSKSKESSA